MTTAPQSRNPHPVDACARRAHEGALAQLSPDTLARLRDAGFLAGGRLPLARGHMLRVLSGTQQGWFGRYPLAPAFVAALQGALAENPME